MAFLRQEAKAISEEVGVEAGRARMRSSFRPTDSIRSAITTVTSTAVQLESLLMQSFSNGGGVDINDDDDDSMTDELRRLGLEEESIHHELEDFDSHHQPVDYEDTDEMDLSELEHLRELDMHELVGRDELSYVLEETQNLSQSSSLSRRLESLDIDVPSETSETRDQEEHAAPFGEIVAPPESSEDLSSIGQDGASRAQNLGRPGMASPTLASPTPDEILPQPGWKRMVSILGEGGVSSRDINAERSSFVSDAGNPFDETVAREIDVRRSSPVNDGAIAIDDNVANKPKREFRDGPVPCRSRPTSFVVTLAALAFGRHEYRSTPFLTLQKGRNDGYARTYEGGVCVFMATAIAASAYYSNAYSDPVQFGALVFLVPSLVTLVEVKLPHKREETLIALVIVVSHFLLNRVLIPALSGA